MAPIDDDDDDSVYSDGPLPAPSVLLKETVLDPSECVLLDDVLDEEEERYQLEHDATSSASAASVSASPYASASVSASGSVVELDDHDHHQVPEAPVIEELRQSMDALHVVAEGFGDHLDQPAVADVTSFSTLHNDDDDWFDSDEQKEVESLESSDDSIRASSDRVDPNSKTMPNHISANVTTTYTNNNTAQNTTEKKSNGGGFSLLTRASQTFYKAFRKGTKKQSANTSLAHGAMKNSDGLDITSQQRAEQIDQMHVRLDHLLEAQIATLNGAKTGFVDLRLMQPMTEKTLEAIEKDAKSLLADFGALERRGKELEHDARKAQKEADDELEHKEQILIAAKVRLAEAAAEVDELRHELKSVQKELAKPESVERRKREQRRKEAQRLKLEAKNIGEARQEAEKKLGERRRSLVRERQEVERLESGYRDMEGDWDV